MDTLHDVLSGTGIFLLRAYMYTYKPKVPAFVDNITKYILIKFILLFMLMYLDSRSVLTASINASIIMSIGALLHWIERERYPCVVNSVTRA
jgi:hypothetical protein